MAIQLNDTHPAIAIPELMRLLMDVEGLEWEQAWKVVQQTFAYTNHTVMPEAMEKWPTRIFEKLLPRHMQIIYRINAEFLRDLEKRYPGDFDRIRRMSIIEEGNERQIRMVPLCIIGSHSVNGVSRIHTNLLTSSVLSDWHEFYPGKFNNKTNGISPRTWLLKCNPELASLITEKIGKGWITNLSLLKQLEQNVFEEDFCKRWQEIKLRNKEKLAHTIRETLGVTVDPRSLFDVQIKRIHEYKRQLLFAFYLITSYLKLKENPNLDFPPRTAIIAGKSAPGYRTAKLIIKFINNIASIINNDPRTSHKLKVVFLPNYRVSLAEKIVAAANLSEQISTAGTEASGTGNMKLALNGALTIGTLDGANVELLEEVGAENLFAFGHTVRELEEIRQKGYQPMDWVNKSEMLKAILITFQTDLFCPKEPGLFRPLLDLVTTHGDYYMIMADFDLYWKCQEEVSKVWKNQIKWTQMSIFNTCRMGKFSSDNVIRSYINDIWKVRTLPVCLPDADRF